MTAAWPDRRALDLFGIELPILQAPMAGSNTSALAIAVCQAGGLGALPCATLSLEQIKKELLLLKQTSRPFNVNFFCHPPPAIDAQREAAWVAKLAPWYVELGLDPGAPRGGATRAPFDAAMCDLVAETLPAVVSFHFGLPARDLLDRVKAAGAKVVSSATTVEEARWLEDHGVDAVIAQGYEAGGHRGMFLTDDVATQPGTMALVPQIVDAVKVPVIAAGAIADGRGIAASFALGAAAVQIGTAYLSCPEATTSPIHRAALKSARDDATVLTNVFTGRPARGLVNRLVRDAGPMAPEAPRFPLATAHAAPLRAAAEAKGSADFSPLWAGQAARLSRAVPAAELTRGLAHDALARLARLGGSGQR